MEKAQQNGNSAAGILLGRIYSDRKEAYYNFQRAVELLLIAAETNDAWAQFFLGRLYWQERHKAGAGRAGAVLVRTGSRRRKCVCKNISGSDPDVL